MNQKLVIDLARVWERTIPLSLKPYLKHLVHVGEAVAIFEIPKGIFGLKDMITEHFYAYQLELKAKLPIDGTCSLVIYCLCKKGNEAELFRRDSAQRTFINAADPNWINDLEIITSCQ